MHIKSNIGDFLQLNSSDTFDTKIEKRIFNKNRYNKRGVKCALQLLRGFFLGIVLISFFRLSQAEALLVPASISELAKGSQAIITGTVVNKQSQWSIDNKTIYTYFTILINQKIKNSTEKNLDPGKTITLRIKGGVVGNIGIDVEDMPVFDLNEAVFLFLDADSGIYPPLPEGA